MEPEFEFADFGEGEHSFIDPSVSINNEPHMFGTTEEIEACMAQLRLELQARSDLWFNDIFKAAPHIRSVGPPRAIVGVGKAGKFFAAIECVLCRKTVRLCFVRSTSGGPFNWIFKRGNYTKHIQRNHKEYSSKKE